MKILKRDVDQAHDAWAVAATRWGDDNLETIRQSARYWEAKTAWEAANGKAYRRDRRRT